MRCPKGTNLDASFQIPIPVLIPTTCRTRIQMRKSPKSGPRPRQFRCSSSWISFELVIWREKRETWDRNRWKYGSQTIGNAKGPEAWWRFLPAPSSLFTSWIPFELVIRQQRRETWYRNRFRDVILCIVNWLVTACDFPSPDSWHGEPEILRRRKVQIVRDPLEGIFHRGSGYNHPGWRFELTSRHPEIDGIDVANPIFTFWTDSEKGPVRLTMNDTKRERANFFNEFQKRYLRLVFLSPAKSFIARKLDQAPIIRTWS
jgi:hypothetical protein